MSYASPALNRLPEPSSIDGFPFPSTQDDGPRALRGEVVAVAGEALA